MFGPHRTALGRRSSFSIESLESRRLLSATLNQPISNVSFAQDSGPETVDLYALFADSTGAADLQFTATSSATSVATTSILGNTLTLKPTAGRSGFTIIKLTATDPTGGTATNVFRVQITALTARSLDVTLDAKHRSVTFVQTDHASATISLSGPGTAVVHFGGDGLKLKGSALQGSHAEMESVTLSNTTGKSHLTIIGASGSGPAMIGNITINNSLGTLDVHKALLLGDVQATGAILSANVDSAESGSITIGSGSTRLTVGTAVDENFQTGGGVSFLQNTQWLNSDDVPETFIAAAIHGMNVRGNFMPDLEVTGTGVKGRALDRVKIRGAVSGEWLVQGETGSLILESSIPSNWQGQFQGIASLTTSGDFSATLTADSVGKFRVHGSLITSTITLTGAGKTDLGSFTAGAIDAAEINSSGNIGSITTATLFNATIFAGVGNIPAGDSLPAQPSDFSQTARIGSIILHPPARNFGFSDSLIAAAKLGNMSLKTSSSKGSIPPYGIATESLDSLTFFDKGRGQTIALRKITTAAQLESTLTARKQTLGDFKLRIL